MTDTKGKLRALFLTALMVFSVFAGTVAFSGAAAAQVDAGNTGFSDAPVFQGESINVEATTYTYTDAEGNEQTIEVGGSDLVQLRRGILGDEDSERVAVGEAVGADDDGPTFTAEQMNVSTGYYFLRSNGQNLENTQFQVVEQDLMASFTSTAYDTGDDGAEADLNVSSPNFFDRDENSDFDVVVNATDLTGPQLAALFDDSNEAGEGLDDTDPITLTVDGDNTPPDSENVVGDLFTADFDDIDADYGDINFTVESAISTASADATATWQEEFDQDANIGSSSYSEDAGDIVEFDVELTGTTKGSVLISGDGLNMWVDVEDGDDDGTVSVELNTLTGEASADGDDSATGAEGVITSTEEATVDDMKGSWTTLQPATFEMEAYPSQEENVDLANDDSTDVASLQLVDGTLDGITVLTGPENHEAFDDSEWDADEEQAQIEAIEDNATESNQVAIRNGQFADSVVVKVDVGGVFGAMEAGVNVDEGIGWWFRETVTHNADTVGWEYTLTDDDSNSLYFVLAQTDTEPVIVADSGLQELTAGQEFEAAFEIIDTNSYVAPGGYEIQTTTFETEQANAAPSTVEEPYQVLAEDGAEIRGTSNVAPGTELRVRAVGADGGFLQVAEDVTVTQNGTWTATYDFADRSVDEEFEISVSPKSFGAQGISGIFADTPEWDTQGDVAQLEQRIEELESENEGLLTILEELNVTINEQSTMLEEQNATIDEQSTMLEEQNATIDELRTQLNESGGASQELLDEKNSTISELELQLDNANQTINNLESVRDSLENEASTYQNQSEDLQSMLDDANATIDERDSTISELESTVSDLEDDLEAAEETTTASGPGFTAVLALVALMGAALLAVRRQQ